MSDLGEVDFSKMTDGELDGTIAKLKVVVNKYYSASEEKNRRNAESQEKANEKFKGSGKFKKLAARFKKAVELLKACSKQQELVVMLPITFTLQTDIYGFDGRDPCRPVDFSDVFSKIHVDARIGQVANINRAQKVILQQGLDSVIDNACGDICELFPVQMAEQKKALAELNAVLEEAEDYDLTFDDLA